MVRIAKKTNPIKLQELKKKIHDEKYLSVAIQQMAQVLSKEILTLKEENRL